MCKAYGIVSIQFKQLNLINTFSMKILHIEDNKTDAMLVQSLLKHANVDFEYFLADTEVVFTDILKRHPIDLILSDYHLPGFSGSEALHITRNLYPEIPFVFVSGTMGEDAAIESLLEGATDYVLKNKLERLVPAVYRAYREAQQQIARGRAESELLKLSQAVDQSTGSVVITNTDGKMMYVNPKTVQLSGYHQDELIGQSPDLFIAAGTGNFTFSSLWPQVLSGKEWKGEVLSKKKNGELYWESATISAIHNEQGKVTNYLMTMEDVSERKRLTDELIKAKEKAEESDRLKTAFLHNISHEIRTPINAIVGFAEFLNEPEFSPEKRKHFAEVIIRNSNQLLGIINDLVSIATIESGQEKVLEHPLSLNGVMQFIYHQFQLKAQEKQLQLNIVTPVTPGSDSIVSDEIKLRQILSNLVSNAFKFTQKGQIDFGYHINHNDVEFFVKDTGIGIPAEFQEEIFKRFRQVETNATRVYGGSGLGLSISKAYVELLGGKMWLTSSLGEGSTFYFNVPLKTAGAKTVPNTEMNTTQINIISGHKTVLIAEDEDANFMLLTILLKSLKLKFIRANNGFEAVDAIRSQQIDMVLMDIKMPGMDGYEATRQIRVLKPFLPIIAQTAYTTDADKAKAMSSGCNDFISKPFKQSMILSVVNKHLYPS